MHPAGVVRLERLARQRVDAPARARQVAAVVGPEQLREPAAQRGRTRTARGRVGAGGRDPLELLGDALVVAALAERGDRLRQRREPRRAAGIEPIGGGERALGAAIEVAAPHRDLGLDREQVALLDLVGAAPQRALDEAGRAQLVLALERLLGRAAELAQRALRGAAAVEVIGEHRGVGVPRRLEPHAGRAVRDDAIGVGQRRVHRVAHERVTELEARARAREDLLVAHRGEVGLGVVDECGHAVGGELVAEHARGAQHAARTRIEDVEARLHHAEHGVGQRVRARSARDRAHHLLEVERMTGRARDERRERRGVDAIAERRADQLLGGRAPSAPSRSSHVARRPQARERVADLRTARSR